MNIKKNQPLPYNTLDKVKKSAALTLTLLGISILSLLIMAGLVTAMIGGLGILAFTYLYVEFKQDVPHVPILIGGKVIRKEVTAFIYWVLRGLLAVGILSLLSLVSLGLVSLGMGLMFIAMAIVVYSLADLGLNGRHDILLINLKEIHEFGDYSGKMESFFSLVKVFMLFLTCLSAVSLGFWGTEVGFFLGTVVLVGSVILLLTIRVMIDIYSSREERSTLTKVEEALLIGIPKYFSLLSKEMKIYERVTNKENIENMNYDEFVFISKAYQAIAKESLDVLNRFPGMNDLYTGIYEDLVERICTSKSITFKKRRVEAQIAKMMSKVIRVNEKESMKTLSRRHSSPVNIDMNKEKPILEEESIFVGDNNSDISYRDEIEKSVSVTVNSEYLDEDYERFLSLSSGYSENSVLSSEELSINNDEYECGYIPIEDSELENENEEEKAEYLVKNETSR